MKPLDWHQLWSKWNKENLSEQWEQEKILPEPMIGRLIAWLTLVVRQQPVTQEEVQRATGLTARVEMLEQRIAALETVVRLARDKSQE